MNEPLEGRIHVKIMGIQHIGIPVTDLKVSEKFYRRLGFTTTLRSSFESGGEYGTLIMMECNHVLIELFEMPDGQLDEVRLRKDGHIDHIAFDVQDIGQTYSEIKKAGIRVEDAEPVYMEIWEKGCRYFTAFGPDGERLEFNQRL
jgi:lactoylglutathione lyase